MVFPEQGDLRVKLRKGWNNLFLWSPWAILSCLNLGIKFDARTQILETVKSLGGPQGGQLELQSSPDHVWILNSKPYVIYLRLRSVLKPITSS